MSRARREHLAHGRSTERVGAIAMRRQIVYKLHRVLPKKWGYLAA